MLDYYGQRQDALGFKLRRNLWAVTVSEMTFKSLQFEAALLDSKGFKASVKRTGRGYKGLIFTPSPRHRRHSVFHENTGTLLVPDIRGVIDTKVICVVLSSIFNWEQSIEDIIFHKDLKKIQRFLFSLRKDIGIIYRTSAFDYLINDF